MYPNNPFIVAEISGNHGGDIATAKDLIRYAKETGADGVKFQTFTPDELAIDCVIEGGPWAGRRYHDLYSETMLPWEWHAELFDYARAIGLTPFSTPFSLKAVEFLESLDCPIYKIASPEICDHRLITAVAKTGKPLIISTGMASLPEILGAYIVATANGAYDITMLHCISAYPAKPADFNMTTLSALLKMNFKVGLSSHCLDPLPAIMATTLGASVIEQHLCMDGQTGPDTAFSLDPLEFMHMVAGCRAAKAALGKITYGCREAEARSYQHRRSIWCVKAIAAGQALAEEHIAVLRPNNGLAPTEYASIIGKKAKRGIPAGTPLSWDLLE